MAKVCKPLPTVGKLWFTLIQDHIYPFLPCLLHILQLLVIWVNLHRLLIWPRYWLGLIYIIDRRILIIVFFGVVVVEINEKRTAIFSISLRVGMTSESYLFPEIMRIKWPTMTRLIPHTTPSPVMFLATLMVNPKTLEGGPTLVFLGRYSPGRCALILSSTHQNFFLLLFFPQPLPQRPITRPYWSTLFSNNLSVCRRP